MAKTMIQPYLFFGGRCEEALEFYCRALGAHVEVLVRSKDSPEPPPPGMLTPGFENKVMHATVRIGEAIFMASDGCDDRSRFDGFRLSLTLPNDAEASRAFTGLFLFSTPGCLFELYRNTHMDALSVHVGLVGPLRVAFSSSPLGRKGAETEPSLVSSIDLPPVSSALRS